MNFLALLRKYMQLCKMKISLLSSFSAVTGFALSAHAFPLDICTPAAAVFLLACGACALNQYQERDVDALMPRTRNRPVPSGKITPGRALVFSIVLMASGLLMLLLSGYVTRLLRSRLLPRFHLEQSIIYNISRVFYYTFLVLSAAFSFQFIGID